MGALTTGVVVVEQAMVKHAMHSVVIIWLKTFIRYCFFVPRV